MLKLFDASQRDVEVIAATAENHRLYIVAVLHVAFLSSLILEFFATVSIAFVAVFVGFRYYLGEVHFLLNFFLLLLTPECFRLLRAMSARYHDRLEVIGSAEAIAALLTTEPSATTVPLRRGTRDIRLRSFARRDRGQSAGELVRGCPDQAAASRLAGVAGIGFQFHGSSSARRWAGWDAMRRGRPPAIPDGRRRSASPSRSGC